MELRTLRYFLTVAREENISRAAEELHLTQPTLSRQIADLEAELQTPLLLRRKKRTILTEEGLLLKARAEEILSLANKTLEEFSKKDEIIAGDVYIGCGETEGMREVIAALSKLTALSPNIRIHLTSGNDELVKERLKNGILDFGLICSSIPPVEYSYLKISHEDIWGIYTLPSNPLGKKRGISAKDLVSEKLIVSRQALEAKEFDHWLKKSAEDLNVVATYNLVFNAAFLARQGLGSVLSFKGLIPERNSDEENLIFRPLTPKLRSFNYLVWKKGQAFSPVGKLALSCFNSTFL